MVSSSSDRGARLLGRFRASAQERLRRCRRVLDEVEAGQGEPAHLVETCREVARELHTLKGESRILDLGGLTELFHLVEELWLRARSPEGVPLPAACQQVGDALSALDQLLRTEEGGVDLRAAGVLAPVREALAAAVADLRGTEEGVPSEVAAERGGVAPSTGTSTSTTEAGRGGSVASASRPHPADRWVQVEAQRVDELAERVGAFSADFGQLAAGLRRLLGERTAAADPVRTGQVREALEEVDRCRARLGELADLAWGLRMVPVAPALNDLAGHAAKLARAQDKRVRCVVRGGTAAMERSVLDALWEPLLHLVRNAVDHGLEPPAERGSKGPEGQLLLQAEARGPHVVLTVADDGRGIHLEDVRRRAVEQERLSEMAAARLSDHELHDLLFEHGFSTRQRVSDLSGRGVGLDLVRTGVAGLGGTITLRSTPGHGSSFELAVPAGLSTERNLVVDVGGVLYGIPSRLVQEVLPVEPDKHWPAGGGLTLLHRDQVLPLLSIGGLLCTPGEERWTLIVELGHRRWALTVPRVVGEFDLLRRSLDPGLAVFGFLAASGLLDDGRLVLVLALEGLLRRASTSTPAVPPKRPEPRPARVLVVDDSTIIRDLIGQVLREAGLIVEVAGDGHEALAAIDRSAPDVVLSDIEMPGMDGFALLQAIRRGGRRLPVIMFTTRTSADDRRRSSELGADGHFSKADFDEGHLVATVRRLTGARA